MCCYFNLFYYLCVMSIGHGGKREGAGRPEKKDKKKRLTLYVEDSKIESVGGEQPAKEIAYKAISKEAKKKKK